MKTFKALYIDNGIIKAGEFPVEPSLNHSLQLDEMHAVYEHDMEEYAGALASAKANAVECEDQEEAKQILNKMESALFLSCCVGSHRLDSTCSLNNRVVPLPSGWDYRVEERKIGGRSVKDKNGIAYDYETYTEKVAKLYRTDEQTKTEELRKKLDAFLATQTKEQLEKWLEMDRERMNTNETLRDEDTSMGIALKFAEKFQAHYPKKPIIPMMVELAKDIDSLVASRISELEAENKRLREEHRWIPVTERLPKEESKWYLCYTLHFEDDPFITCFYADGKWYEESFDITKYVTHWQSIQPPKEQ